MIRIKHSIKLCSHIRHGKGGDYLSLFLRLSMAYHQQDISLGITIDMDQFDCVARVVCNHPNADAINIIIDNAKTCLEDIIKRFEVVEKRRPLSSEVLELFSREFNGVGFVSAKSSMEQIVGEFVRDGVANKSWTKATQDKFYAVLRNLREFDKHVSLDKFSDSYLRKLEEWYVARGYSNPTIYKKIGFVKWLLHWCSSKGFYKGTAHETYLCNLKGANYEQKTIVYLERDELNRLENLDLSNRPYLDRVRDVFVFACYCGLRFSDIQRLEISQIYGKALHVVTKKTNNPVSIELNSHTTRILGKYYDGESLNKKALPTISNQKTNSYLRKICKLAGIDAPIKLVYYKGNDRIEEVMPKYEAITFHASRRTFITMALLLEVPIPVIMQWSGHRNQSALKPYMQVVNELRKKQMSKFDLL